METRSKIYSGILAECQNELFLKYPSRAGRARLRRNLRKLVQKSGFSVIKVHLDKYPQEKKGCQKIESGPGIVVVLGESHFIINAWPERGKKVEFIVNFCERGVNNNNAKAKRVAEHLKEFSGAKKMKIDRITRHGPHLLHKL